MADLDSCICKVCGKGFVNPHRNKITCSDLCRRIRDAELQLIHWSEVMLNLLREQSGSKQI